jgi:hypothetical protein
MPADVRERLGRAYDAKFEFLFNQLAVGGTRAAVERHVKAVPLHRPAPVGAEPLVAAAPDDMDLSD